MTQIKTVLSSLRGKISRKTHGSNENSPTRNGEHEPVRGGDEADVEQKIESRESSAQHDDSGSSSDDTTQSSPPVKELEDFLENNNDPPEISRRYGQLPLMQSVPPERVEGEVSEPWWHLDAITPEHIGREIQFRSRVHVIRNMSAKMAFIVFREGITTVQGVLRAREGEISENMVRFAEHIRPGSIVLVIARIQKAEQKVKTTSTHDVELLIEEMHVETARRDQIPFSVYEAEAITDDHAISDRVRLNNRILDLRTPTSQAIFRIQSGVCNLFRGYLDDQGFIEIHTPKLQGGATEGGSEVFKLSYFGRPAFLAQSPQLPKQMCISADFRRVYEIGPVFRAENSNTPRHLTEYTGLDLEMMIDKHYHEAMHMIDATLKHIFSGIYKKYPLELQAVKHHFPHEDLVWNETTTRITFAEGARLLNESGWKNEDGSQQSELEDLSTRAERELGRLVKEKYHTDYYILDKFPASARPFYTMPDYESKKITNSFDFMVRGQEILSGGQRVHDYNMLVDQIKAKDMNPNDLKEYLDGFRYVAPPHAGAGIGLERLVSLILELGNLRFASLFHRDPRSFPAAQKSELRHPEDSTLHRPKGYLQPLENLIANYGDSTNTSWMDEKFKIWRDDKTGAAVSYTPSHSRAIVAGDPLCDPSQYGDVIEAFFYWLKSETKLKPIFLLVGQPVEEVLATRFGFRSFTNTAEQRVNLENNSHATTDKEMERKMRHAAKDGVEVTDYGSSVPDDIRAICDERIKEWQSQREGEQVHLSEITPWVDSEHRQYFIAASRHKEHTSDSTTNSTSNLTIHSLVVLATLSLRHGTQLKWALDFPNATNGAIELAVTTALKTAADAGTVSATFGAGATPDLSVGHNMSTAKAASLEKIYQSLAKRFNVANKAGFRTKFNTVNDPLFICYAAKGGLGRKGIRAIVDFFKD